MVFSEKKGGLELFAKIYQNDAFLFSEISFGFSLSLFDTVKITNVISVPLFDKGNYQNNFSEKIVKTNCWICLKTSLSVVLSILVQSWLKGFGFLPGEAYATPAPTSRVAAIVSPLTDTLHIQDNSYRQSKRVVIPALQLRFNGRGTRGPLTTRAALVAKPAKYSTQTQTGVLTHARFDMAQFVNNNHVIKGAHLQANQIIITKKDLIFNQNFTKAQKIFVHKQVDNLAKNLSQESRVDGVKKVLNIQGWKMINGVPTLKFNADASYGPYSQNKRMSITIKKVLNQFLEKNADIYKMFF